MARARIAAIVSGPWLHEHGSVVEAIVEYGRKEVLRRLAHPFWFQSLGARSAIPCQIGAKSETDLKNVGKRGTAS